MYGYHARLCLMKMYTSFLLFLSTSTVCVAPCVGNGARRATDTIQQQLLTYIQQERTLRTSLETRVAALRAAAEQLNETIVPCSCQTPTKNASSLAYTGTLQNYIKGLTGSSKFNFTGDLTNLGEAFNLTSARFMAKVPGLYGFSVTIYMTHGYWLALQLVKNDREAILYVRTGHLQTFKVNRHNNMGTNFGVTYLEAGDEVWLKYIDSSNSILYAGGVTTFSGVLLHEM